MIARHNPAKNFSRTALLAAALLVCVYSVGAYHYDPARTLIPGSRGEYAWGGAATTSFWIDPAEELIAIFMTQVLPSSATPIRRELRTMIYAAITESNS